MALVFPKTKAILISQMFPNKHYTLNLTWNKAVYYDCLIPKKNKAKYAQCSEEKYNYLIPI